MSVIERAKGKLKQAVGELRDDPILTEEGRAQEAKGEAASHASRARVDAAVADAEASVHEARQRGAERVKTQISRLKRK